MTAIAKPTGCEGHQHNAKYSVGLDNGKLKFRKEVVAGKCSIGEPTWDHTWNELVTRRIEYIFVCEKTFTKLGIRW
jgi:hypothetical protein